MAQQFAPLAERIIDAVVAADPGIAAFAGDHRFDDRLPDLSADGVARDVAMLRDAANALSQVDIEALDRQEAVDHSALMSLVDRAYFELTEVRGHEWNPLEHNPGGLLYGLIARPFAPAEQRLQSLAGRLSAIPDALATARSLLGGPAADETVRAALDRLAQEHPDNTSIVDLAKVTLEEATTFVREHDLVSLTDDPCVIMEMPEFARGVAVAYCDPPGPLETADVPTFYCIAPTPSDWSPERVESFYREYNNHMIRDLTVHEAMPGHFLQLAHARRFDGSTRARALGFSGPFVEGWAVYGEEVMVEHGFGGLPVRLQQLKTQLRMTINAILDQLVHCEGLSEVDAMALMMHRGFQEEGEAAGKWRRALLTSTQLSTYFVGYTEVSAMSRARPAGTSVRAWHDAMLAHGSPAPRHVRTLLGV